MVRAADSIGFGPHTTTEVGFVAAVCTLEPYSHPGFVSSPVNWLNSSVVEVLQSHLISANPFSSQGRENV